MLGANEKGKNRIQKMHHGAGLTRGQKLFRQCQFERPTFQKGVSLNATTVLGRNCVKTRPKGILIKRPIQKAL